MGLNAVLVVRKLSKDSSTSVFNELFSQGPLITRRAGDGGSWSIVVSSSIVVACIRPSYQLFENPQLTSRNFLFFYLLIIDIVFIHTYSLSSSTANLPVAWTIAFLSNSVTNESCPTNPLNVICFNPPQGAKCKIKNIGGMPGLGNFYRKSLKNIGQLNVEIY